MIFSELSKKYYEIINKELDLFLSKQIKDLESSEPFIKECYSMIKDFTMIGGKRLRPIALILAYVSSGGKQEKKVYLPSLAIELHQTYSLILDDIMDEDDYRRGHPGINKKLKEYFLKNSKDETYNGNLFNKQSSKFAVSNAIMLANITNILSKKALFASDFSDEIKIKALNIIESTDEKIYHGQMMDGLMEKKKTATEVEYLEMIKNKTAVFFGMSFELGALFAGADENTQVILKEFGIASALSFQIQDDLLDLTSGKGHEIGSDIKKGKKTLLILKALEKADTSQNKIISNVFWNPEATEESIKKVIKIMHDTGAIDYCKRLAIQKNIMAKEILKSARIDTTYKNIFFEMADFMLERKV